MAAVADDASRALWEHALHVIAYAAVIAVGLLVGVVIGGVMALVTGLIPFRC